MNKPMIVISAVAALGLAACSPKAQNETADAANTMVSDMNATAVEAINDVDAATNSVDNAAGNALDRAANDMDKAGAAAGNASDKLRSAADTVMNH